MTPVESGRYQYVPESIVEIRKKLNLNQRSMAKLIGVEINSLSRWETGATTPDATMLAKIYSIAMEHGIKPTFFQVKKSKGRYRLIVIWDFQNFGVSYYDAAEVSDWIQYELEKKFSTTTYHLYKVFSYSHQSNATDALMKKGWRVWEDSRDFDEEIYEQSFSDCGHDPSGTIFVMITRDGDFSDLIEDLKSEGVRIYLLAPENASEELIQAVGKKRWIKWSI